MHVGSTSNKMYYCANYSVAISSFHLTFTNTAETSVHAFLIMATSSRFTQNRPKSITILTKSALATWPVRAKWPSLEQCHFTAVLMDTLLTYALGQEQLGHEASRQSRFHILLPSTHHGCSPCTLRAGFQMQAIAASSPSDRSCIANCNWKAWKLAYPGKLMFFCSLCTSMSSHLWGRPCSIVQGQYSKAITAALCSSVPNKSGSSFNIDECYCKLGVSLKNRVSSQAICQMFL